VRVPNPPPTSNEEHRHAFRQERYGALVVIDPQNDVLSEPGVSWGLVGASVRENNTIENLARLFAAAKGADFGVFISPHYLYPHD
jgi:Isochorismatase family